MISTIEIIRSNPEIQFIRMTNEEFVEKTNNNFENLYKGREDSLWFLNPGEVLQIIDHENWNRGYRCYICEGGFFSDYAIFVDAFEQYAICEYHLEGIE